MPYERILRTTFSLLPRNETYALHLWTVGVASHRPATDSTGSGYFHMWARGRRKGDEHPVKVKTRME